MARNFARYFAEDVWVQEPSSLRPRYRGAQLLSSAQPTCQAVRPSQAAKPRLLSTTEAGQDLGRSLQSAPSQCRILVDSRAPHAGGSSRGPRQDVLHTGVLSLFCGRRPRCFLGALRCIPSNTERQHLHPASRRRVRNRETTM